MKFHGPGVEPPLMKIYKETGDVPAPTLRWSWEQRRFQVSYDNGYNWYDRLAARDAERRVIRRMNIDRMVGFLRSR